MVASKTYMWTGPVTWDGFALGVALACADADHDVLGLALEVAGDVEEAVSAELRERRSPGP